MHARIHAFNRRLKAQKGMRKRKLSLSVANKANFVSKKLTQVTLNYVSLRTKNQWYSRLKAELVGVYIVKTKS